MKPEHIKLVEEVLTKACNGQHVYEFEYGLALLACSEALKEAAEQEPQGAPRAVVACADGVCGSPICVRCARPNGLGFEPQVAPRETPPGDPTDHEAVLYEADPAGYRQSARETPPVREAPYNIDETNAVTGRVR